METWKDIPTYEGLYQISNTGKVKSISRWWDIGLGRRKLLKERILKHAFTTGYPSVALCDKRGQKTTLIHRLMANAFIPNPDNLPQVNHKNGIRHDNRLENLEWVTSQENIQHAYTVLKRTPSRKISSDQVIQIRALFKNLGLRMPHLAAMYSVNSTTIHGIVHKNTRLNG